MFLFRRKQPAPDAQREHGSSRHPDLPLVVLRAIFSYSSPQQWPALRLASKQLAVVGSEFISRLTIKSWAKQQVPPPALLHGLRQRIKLLRVVGKPDWCRLQRLLSCKTKHAGTRRAMSQLRHVILQEPHLPLAIPSSCATLLQGINRLDIACPGVLVLPRFAKLPGLRTASFACTISLVQLAQVAPNLQQLWASVLDCSPSALSADSKDSSSASAAAVARLVRLTHLGCRTLIGVRIGPAAAAASPSQVASSEAEGAAAALTGSASSSENASSFPSLQVLTCLPSMAAPCSGTSPQAASNSSSSSRVTFEPCIFQPGALGPCPGLQSVRISGNFGYASAAAALQQLLDSPVELEHLTRLSLHSGSRCISAFTCINALSQLQPLQHVTVTGACSRPERVALLLDQMVLVPQLQALALPAELLCRQCSRSGASGAVQHALDELVMHSSSLTRLVFLPGGAARVQQQQHNNGSSGNGSFGNIADGGGSSTSESSCAAGKCGRTEASNPSSGDGSVATASSTSSSHAQGSSSCLSCDRTSSTSSSFNSSCRAGSTLGCSACPHPSQVSQRAATLHRAWQAAAAFEGLSLAATVVGSTAGNAPCSSTAADESRTLSSMRQRWQQEQQQAKQQEHQQRMQRLQQLCVEVVGLPGCPASRSAACSAYHNGSGCCSACGCSAACDVVPGGNVMQEAGVWGVYGPACEW